MKDRESTFIEKLHECNQHRKRLVSGRKYLESLLPLDLEKYNNLDDITISIIDQMIFRFSKLQDSLGDKIFPEILELNGENVKRLSFIDRLNRLEELELLNKLEWMTLRKDRNEIAHEYSFNQQDVVESINLIYTKCPKLLNTYDDIYRYCFKQFDFVKRSTILKESRTNAI